MAVRQRTQAGSAAPSAAKRAPGGQGSWMRLLFYVLGIYASFLTWAVLQERIATTPYGPDLRVFRASNAISAVQSLLACSAGFVFLRATSAAGIVPRRGAVVARYLVVALCQVCSSVVSFSSLRYVDFITMLLAKSCKLLPVMAVHLLVYRRRFPLYKYAVVACVTAGVSIFSLHQAAAKASAGSDNPALGFVLLGLSLFLDGLYNTTQDEMFAKYGRSGEVTGPHMMVVLNFFTAVLALAVLLVRTDERGETLWFLANHPQVFRDIFLFGLCGAVGQIFIFLTLERFGSLALVTTTVTRKMISMLLSVVLFNHRLGRLQWVGVALVFGGIAGEAAYKQLQRPARGA